MELAPAPLRTDGDPLRVGFVALVDSAPLVVAKETGIFAAHGLDVALLRQPGWASVRDKIVSGELDASQAVCGLPFAIAYGLGGARRDCLTGLLLNTHGNAITISDRLWEAGVRSADHLAAEIRRGTSGRPLVFGVVHPYSSHHFLLHAWLRSAGMRPGREVQLVNVPPTLMIRNLAAGNLDGFCVGEPWNTASIYEGIGHCIASSAGLCPNHPEKCLLVTKEFCERRAAEHGRLIAALLESCAFCDLPRNREAVAEMLARPGYINLSEEVLMKSLRCDLMHTEKAGAVKLPIHRFSGEAVNRPSAQKASWILEQMKLCGVGPPAGVRDLPSAGDVFRADLFDAAVASKVTLGAAPRSVTS